MSVNSATQPAASSPQPFGLVPAPTTPANDNAATAKSYVANGTLDKAVRAGTNAFMNPETASGTANEQQPGYVGPQGMAVPVGLPEKGYGTAATNTPAADGPDKDRPTADGDRNAARGASAARSEAPAAGASDADRDRTAQPDATEERGKRARYTGVPRDNAGAASGTAWGDNHQAVAGEGADVSKQNSAKFSTSTTGDANNGQKSTVQGGAWSATGAKTQNDADGVAARASAEGNAGGQVNGGFSKTAGNAAVDGNGSAWGGAQGRTSAGASASKDSGLYAQAGAEGRFGAGAEGQTTARVGPGEVGVNGKTAIGGETSNGFMFGSRVPTPEERAAGITGKTGVEASAGGFVGAKAEGGVKAGVGGNTIGVEGGLYAGFGAAAKFNAGIEKDDKGKTYLNIGGSFGAAMGFGAKIGGSLRINITPLVKAFDASKETIGKAFNEVKEFAGKVWNGAKDIGNKIAEGAKDVGHKIADGAKGFVNKIADGAKRLFGA
jgi:hypothetical protein